MVSSACNTDTEEQTAHCWFTATRPTRRDLCEVRLCSRSIQPPSGRVNNPQLSRTSSRSWTRCVLAMFGCARSPPKSYTGRSRLPTRQRRERRAARDGRSRARPAAQRGGFPRRCQASNYGSATRRRPPRAPPTMSTSSARSQPAPITTAWVSASASAASARRATPRSSAAGSIWKPGFCLT